MSHPAKVMVAIAIEQAIKKTGMSKREFSDSISMNRMQLYRFLNSGNYTMDSLLRILDGLDLTISVKKNVQIGHPYD